MDDQAWLREAAIRRFTEVAQGLPGAAGGDPVAGGAAPAGLRAMAVVRTLDPAAFLTGTVAFAAAIPAPLRDPWYRTFTRTVFLAGNPAWIGRRFRYDHAAAGEIIAWYGPAPQRRDEGLVRALRLFRGSCPLPDPPAAAIPVPVPGGPPTGGTAALAVATGGVSTGDYLIHVNHTLCEALLRGLVGPGDTVVVRHVPHLDPGRTRTCPAGRTYLRVAEDPARPGTLRLFARLTTTGTGTTTTTDETGGPSDG